MNNEVKRNMTPNKLEIHHYDSADKAQAAATDELTKVLETSLSEKKKILLLLSGGGNLQVAEQVGLRLLNNEDITIYVLDERFSADATLNNSLQLQKIGIAVNLTVPTETETVAQFAERFNLQIQTWVDQNPDGQIICTWGMGPDGHVAGISPMPDEPERFAQTFIGRQQIVVGYTGNLVPPERVTVTADFLTNQVDILLGFVSGAAKESAWQSFVEMTVPESQLPVQLFKRAQGRVIISTDL